MEHGVNKVIVFPSIRMNSCPCFSSYKHELSEEQKIYTTLRKHLAKNKFKDTFKTSLFYCIIKYIFNQQQFY